MPKILASAAMVLLLATAAADAQQASTFHSLNPPSGFGNSQNFVVTYQVPTGVAINAVYFAAALGESIYSIFSLANTCTVIYEFAPNTFRLINDAGDGWSAPLAPNSGSAQNKSCTFNSAGASVSRTGNLVSVTFPISFPADRIGLHRTFTNKSDSPPGTGFWQPIGSWTVPGTAVLNGPDVVDVWQQSIGDYGYRFTNTFRHAGGASQQYLDYFLLLPLPNTANFTAAGTCLVEYNRISNGVRLINDAGNNWLGPPEGVRIQPGTPPLVNSVCQVDVANMNVMTAGTDVHVTTPIALAPSFHAQRLGIFLQQQDMQGVWTDFRQMTWFRGGNAVPGRRPFWTFASLNPPSLPAATAFLEMATGVPIDTVHFRLTPNITGSLFCHVVYFRGTNTLNLIDDAGTGFVSETGIAPGSGTLQNSRCTLNGANTSISFSTSGGDAAFIIGLTHNEQTFSAPKQLFVNAFDTLGNVTHWWPGNYMTTAPARAH
jgi:hypothetical protein